MPIPEKTNEIRDRKANRHTAWALLAIAAGMLMLAYASPMLYRTFCRLTGFAGTPLVALSAPKSMLAHQVAVDFNTDIEAGLPIEFVPIEPSVRVHVGESRIAQFRVKNLSNAPLTVVASYNVVPDEMGGYFNKIQCFCFNNLTLKAHEEQTLPVSFFIDPSVAENPYLKNIGNITLSYTFFAVDKKTK